MNKVTDYNNAQAINPDSEVRPKEAVINAYTEVFFELEVVTVGGIEITLDNVLGEIEFELNQVSALLMRGKADEATELNYEILTKHVESLIIDAMASN